MRIVIGEGSCGIAAGAQKVRSALEALITEPIGSTGCIGMCYLEPIVDLYEGKQLVRRLVRVSDKDAEAIAEAVKTGDLTKVDSITITPDDEEFLTKQTRIALRHCGLIDPNSLEDYIAADGYAGLRKVLTTMTPEQVIEEIKISSMTCSGVMVVRTFFRPA